MKTRTSPFSLFFLSVLCPGALLLGLGGCNAHQVRVGSGGVVGTYRSPTLTADLPSTARVPAVLAAADKTFRDRGYAIENSSVTEEYGTILAMPPRTGDYPKVRVIATVIPGGTRLEVAELPFGSEDTSRSIADGILSKIGL
jgi:hypothetical protein